MEDEELHFLLEQRGKYLMQMQAVAEDPNSGLSSPLSDDSESSDDESDPSKVNIKSEPTDHTNDMQQDVDESHNVDNVEQPVKINIKQERMDDKINCKKENDNAIEVENDKQVVNGEVGIDETEKTASNDNETEKTDEDQSDQEDQIELKTSVKVVKQQGKTKEEENCNAVKPTNRCRRKSKRDILENDHTTKTESKKSIKIKQEHEEDDFDDDEDMVDGVRRELRPRKLNESRIYFEPYDGSSSDESDFSDLLN